MAQVELSKMGGTDVPPAGPAEDTHAINVRRAGRYDPPLHPSALRRLCVSSASTIISTFAITIICATMVSNANVFTFTFAFASPPLLGAEREK